MSTATQAAPPVLPLPATRARGKFLGKNVWALGDQILISGSNFLTMVLTARAMSPSDFGTFTLAYSALLLANILQSTLITQPHNVLGANLTGEGYRRYTANTGLCQLLLVGIEAAIALLVAAILGARHSPSTMLLVWVAPSIVAWQLQEFVRRVLYTENRFEGAFWNDVISYGGQTLVVGALWATNSLDGITAMAALAATSAAAVGLGVWQIRGSLKWTLDLSVFTENWAFGKWLTGGELLQWFASLQMYLFLTAWMLGTQATGKLRAAQILFGPTRIFAFYLGSVLPIQFARALAADGSQAVHVLLLKACKRVLPLLGAYCLIVAVFPKVLLRLTYDNQYTGAAAVLSLYSICAFISYCQVLLTSALTAKRLTRPIFLGNVYGACIAVAMSYWIIHWFKVAGAPIAMGVSSIIITAYFWRAYTASRAESDTTTEQPLEPAGAAA